MHQTGAIHKHFDKTYSMNNFNWMYCIIYNAIKIQDELTDIEPSKKCLEILQTSINNSTSDKYDRTFWFIQQQLIQTISQHANGYEWMIFNLKT